MQEILKAQDLVDAIPGGAAPVDTTWDTAQDHSGRFSFNGNNTNTNNKHKAAKSPVDTPESFAGGSTGGELLDDPLRGECFQHGLFLFASCCFLCWQWQQHMPCTSDLQTCPSAVVHLIAFSRALHSTFCGSQLRSIHRCSAVAAPTELFAAANISPVPRHLTEIPSSPNNVFHPVQQLVLLQQLCRCEEPCPCMATVARVSQQLTRQSVVHSP